MIDAAQVRGARGLLGMSQVELSRMAEVSAATIKRVEAGTQSRGSADTLRRIQRALETKGVEFIPPDGGKGPGVRLRLRDADTGSTAKHKNRLP